MKAIRIHQYGPPDSLQLEEVNKPTPGDQQVLVKVFAAGVNHIDYLKASGALKEFYPLQFPWIPGRDFAGVVVGIGNGVKGINIGDEVYGDAVDGGAFAEYVVANASAIAEKPKTLSFTEAATVPVAAETAWQAFTLHSGLQKNQTILIHGAAGAVGGYAVQIAKLFEFKVIAIASLRHTEYLKSLGADMIFDHEENLFDILKGKADVVLDLIGGALQEKCFMALKAGGQLIATNQPPSQELAAKYNVKAKMMHQSPTREGLSHIANLFDTGKLKPNVAIHYTLEDAPEAWKNIQQNYMNREGRNGEQPNGRHVIDLMVS